jgi:hypothetical protein
VGCSKNLLRYHDFLLFKFRMPAIPFLFWFHLFLLLIRSVEIVTHLPELLYLSSALQWCELYQVSQITNTSMPVPEALTGKASFTISFHLSKILLDVRSGILNRQDTCLSIQSVFIC